MKSRPVTIARGMGLVAVLAVNAALVRAFVVQEMFIGGILLFIILQIGFWSLLRSGGRRRLFWTGFEVSGMIAVFSLFSCDLLPNSRLARLVMWYTDIAANWSFSHLPLPLTDHFEEHQDHLLAILCFMPELLVALLGGMIAASLVRNRPASTHPTNRETSASLAGADDRARMD